MRLTDAGRMAKLANLGLQGLARPVCPKTQYHYGNQVHKQSKLITVNATV